MLNLNAGIHFHEIELSSFVNEKLKSPDIRITDFPDRLHDAAPHFLTKFRSHHDGGGFLDELLMATLDGALPFTKMDRVSKLVCDNLKLNVPRPLDELFQVAMWHAKRADSFRLGRFQGGEQLAAAPNDAHASSASTGNRLDDHRITNRFGDCNGLFVRVNGVRASGQNQKPKPVHLPAGAGLVPHQANGFGRRTDEFDLAGLTNFSKVSALREKAISGMDGIDVRDLGGANDARYVQVAVRAPGRANTNCLVRKAYMQRVPVRFREHGNGLDAEFLTRVNNSEGYLSAVSDEYFLEHRSIGDEWRTDFRHILPVARFRPVC